MRLRREGVGPAEGVARRVAEGVAGAHWIIPCQILLPLPVSIPKQLGSGVDKTSQHLFLWILTTLLIN